MQNAIPMLLGMPGMLISFPVPIEQAASLVVLTTASILGNFCPLVDPLVDGSIQGIGREDITLTPEEARAPTYYTLPIHRIGEDELFQSQPKTRDKSPDELSIQERERLEVTTFFEDDAPAKPPTDDAQKPLFVRAHVSHLDWRPDRFWRTAFEVTFAAKRLAGENHLPYIIPNTGGWVLKEFLESDIPVIGSEGVVFEDTGKPIGSSAGAATFVNPEGRLVRFDLTRPDIAAAITAGYEGHGAAASIRMNIYGDTFNSSTDSYFFGLKGEAVERFVASSGRVLKGYARKLPKSALGRYTSSQGNVKSSLLEAGRFVASLVFESSLFQDHGQVGELIETLSDTGFSIISQSARESEARSSEPGPLIHIEGTYDQETNKIGSLKIRLRNPLCNPIEKYHCDFLELGFFLADVLWNPIAKIAAPDTFAPPTIPESRRSQSN